MWGSFAEMTVQHSLDSCLTTIRANLKDGELDAARSLKRKWPRRWPLMKLEERGKLPQPELLTGERMGNGGSSQDSLNYTSEGVESRIYMSAMSKSTCGKENTR